MISKIIVSNTILSLIFWLALAVPLCGFFLALGQQPGDETGENRFLAKFPGIPRTSADIREFPAKFEAYFADHFGLRAKLVNISTAARYQLGMRLGFILETGRDGWTFVMYEGLLDGIRGASPFEPEELEAIGNQLQALDAKLEARGKALVVAIIPEKHSIYPEKLPRAVRFLGPGRLDQLNAAQRDRAYYVDLKTPLLSAKGEEGLPDLYFRINSHWNCLAAFMAYEEILSGNLAQRVPGLLTVSGGDFSYMEFPPDDRANPLSPQYWLTPLKYKEAESECLLPPAGDLQLQHFRTGAVYPNINGEKALPESVPGQPPRLQVPWVSVNGPGQRNALVIRDSYASYMLHYFSRSFDKVFYAHVKRLGAMNLQTVFEEVSPDVVVLLVSERYLSDFGATVLTPLEAALSSPSR